MPTLMPATLAANTASIKTKNPKFAVNDSFSANEETSFSGVVLANDTAPPNSSKSVYSISQAGGSKVETTAFSKMGATLTLNADGTMSYNPTGASAIQALAQDEKATDTFIYTLKLTGKNGAFSLDDAATVAVNLTGVNDPPTFTGNVKGSIKDEEKFKFSGFTIGDPDNVYLPQLHRARPWGR